MEQNYWSSDTLMIKKGKNKEKILLSKICKLSNFSETNVHKENNKIKSYLKAVITVFVVYNNFRRNGKLKCTFENIAAFMKFGLHSFQKNYNFRDKKIIV